MVNVLGLEEMLDWIGPSVAEETVMTTEDAYRRMEQGKYTFLPTEYLSKARSILKPSDFPNVVWECINNAANRGNKGKKELPITVKVHRGELGIVVEVQDSGDGIPAEQIEKLLRDGPNKDCLYQNGRRGMGFYTLRTRLETNIVNAIGFNEKRNAIYLMALF